MVSTAQILAERALQRTCDERCIDWAIGLLESGHDGILICQMAAMLPPHNHFELAVLRDKILMDLGVQETSIDDAILMYATELLQAANDGILDSETAVTKVADLCIENDYQSAIFDFFLLYWANKDLREQGFQYYWQNANRGNIEEVIQARIQEFLAAQRDRGTSNE